MKRAICCLGSLLWVSACYVVDPVDDPPGVRKAIAALKGSQEPPPPPPSLRDDPACRLLCWPLTPTRARKILEQTKMFATTGVSVAGEPTPQVAAFNTLLEQPDRESILVALSENANIVGRLYALCGLQALALNQAQTVERQLRTVQGTAVVFDGCEQSEKSIPAAVDLVNSRSFGRAFVDARGRTYEYFAKLASGKVDWTGVCGQLGRQECPPDGAQ